MAAVNKVILIGNLGADPEMRYAPSGDAIATIRLATTESWKDKATGEKQEKTEWHRVVMFGKQAEIAGEYLKKGKQVYFEGRLQTKKWQDKEGHERYTTEIIADRMQMLGTRESGGGSFDATPTRGGGSFDAAPTRGGSGGGDTAAKPPQARKSGGFDDMADEDMPF